MVFVGLSGLAGMCLADCGLDGPQIAMVFIGIWSLFCGVFIVALLFSSSKADREMKRLDREDIERRARILADTLRSEMSASAVIADDDFAAGGMEQSGGGDREIRQRPPAASRYES